MQKFETSISSLGRSMLQHKGLILSFARRDVVGRYKGSMFGILWSLLTPLFMLAIYTFVFGAIFKARWGVGSTSKTEFAIVLFAGLIVFNIFSECIGRAPSTILSNANFVKKVVFPLEILPLAHLLSALFHAVISLLVLLVFEATIGNGVPVTVFLLPVVMAPFLLFVAGLSWWLAATGVYFRDIGQTIGLMITALMFLSPVFFPISSLPQQWQIVAKFNPLTLPIEQARNVIVWGAPVHWGEWAAYSLACCAVAWLGYAWFQKTRKGFADVL
ncbi:ABC transporter permease [Cupriavidus taiwanensis]|uniref:ABC transporter permease n=1 Tax=Cupriavidus taiwanensis TaxID=164546 RepID=UPI000E2E83C6|nr:ABC transporter permease [Cupriavidus taiwanensis]